MSQQPLAQLSGAHKRFGNIAALDGLNLAVNRGEMLALLGPNGAGKSTAISLLLGLQKPGPRLGRCCSAKTPQSIDARRRIGVMMQEINLPGVMRPRELIAQVASYYPSPYDVQAVIKRLGIEKIADRPYGKLSGGQKRQAQFAMAICRPAGAAVPRRAHGGPRCAGARSPVAGAARPDPRRLLHRPDHALHRRGRGAGQSRGRGHARPAGGQRHRRRSARPRDAQAHPVPHHPAARDPAGLARGAGSQRGFRSPPDLHARGGVGAAQAAGGRRRHPRHRGASAPASPRPSPRSPVPTPPAPASRRHCNERHVIRR